MATGIALVLAALLFWCWWRRPGAAQGSVPEPLPEPERSALCNAVPQASWLDADTQERWFSQVQRFRSGKRFIACAGHELGEDQVLRIAGLACLLRLQPGAERAPLFPAVREVLVYPDAFRVPPPSLPLDVEGLELVSDEPDERIGEQGPGQVVLSWADVEAALAGNPVNVVIHEFAHALDEENPDSEGAPPMAAELAGDWARVMGAEYARLQRHRRPPVLDKYGAESPAEFFGVVSEAFFQQPAALFRHHGRLFELLARYYRLAPPV